MEATMKSTIQLLILVAAVVANASCSHNGKRTPAQTHPPTRSCDQFRSEVREDFERSWENAQPHFDTSESNLSAKMSALRSTLTSSDRDTIASYSADYERRLIPIYADLRVYMADR